MNGNFPLRCALNTGVECKLIFVVAHNKSSTICGYGDVINGVFSYERKDGERVQSTQQRNRKFVFNPSIVVSRGRFEEMVFLPFSNFL